MLLTGSLRHVSGFPASEFTAFPVNSGFSDYYDRDSTSLRLADLNGCTVSIGGELFKCELSSSHYYFTRISDGKHVFSIYDNGYHPCVSVFLSSNGENTFFGYGNYVAGVSTPFIILSGPSETFKYIQSASVNGSASLGALEAANLDESDKVYPIAPVTKVVSSGLAGSTTAPGLSAEEYEKILADVLASTAVIPTTPQPTTAEPEPTTATPEEDKTHVITPDILGGMFEGLKGWLQSLLNSILEAIQAIPEKIDSLWESMKAWWTQTIADVKAWIEVKIQSISDWWTTFWAETKALILSISNAITEFFTVTFPAWITDVR